MKIDSKNKQIVTVVVLAIVFAGFGFWGGDVYANSHRSATRGGFAGGAAAGRTGGAARMGSFVTGSVISEDSNSITVQSAMGGSSKIVLFSGSTQVLKSTTGTTSDITTGTNVVVTGTTNSDGSLTAQSIQIRPAGQVGPGR